MLSCPEAGAAAVAARAAAACSDLQRALCAAGGATALIAATLPELPKWHGYSYIVTIGLGTVVMQIIGEQPIIMLRCAALRCATLRHVLPSQRPLALAARTS